VEYYGRDAEAEESEECGKSAARGGWRRYSKGKRRAKSWVSREKV